jgi:transposase-like protein
METTKKQGGVSRKQRTDQEIYDAMEEAGSQLSVSDFCELFEIGRSTYYEWEKKYKQMKGQQTGGQPREDEPIRIHFTDAELNPVKPFLEVHHPDGRLFRFFEKGDESFIKNIMA